MQLQYIEGLAKQPSGIYLYCFRVGGKQFKGTTGTPNLREAKKILAQKRADILEPPVLTTQKLVDRWLLDHTGVVSDHHYRSVKGCASTWIIPEFKSKKIDAIQSEDIISLRASILEAGRSRETVNHVLRVVRLLWSYGVRMSLLETVPFEVKTLRVQRKPRPVVPLLKCKEFLATLDQEARNPQVQVMLRVMLGLGLREAEVLGMRWEWVDKDQRTYTVGKAKNFQIRVLPIPEWIWDRLDKLPRSSEWVFPQRSGEPHRPNVCKKPLARVAEKLGLGKVTQHRLRASFATLHASVGTPISEIQAMLGHAKITTTCRYLEQSVDLKKEAQQKLQRSMNLD